VRQGLTTNARETGGGEEDVVKAAIVFKSRGEIEAASAMLGPRLAREGRVESDDKLAGGVNGVGGKVERHTKKTTMSRERGVEALRAYVI
jgi:hypothetical protein